MSNINGLGGPRLPTLTPSPTRNTSGSSFLSRVQATASGATAIPSRPGNASGVSGKDIVSKAVDTATQGAAPVDAQQKAIQDMSRSFVMGIAQSIFGDIGQSAPQIEKE